MPLNYSKWDMLELSDDSDIEEHPNVDKASMIRWKQRDIHEKRDARKLQLAKLRSELALNAVLRPRIAAVRAGLAERGLAHVRAVRRRIAEEPSAERPETGAPNQPTYDMMLGQLLGDVWREACVLADGGAWRDGAVWTAAGDRVDEKTALPGWAEGEVTEGKAQAVQAALDGRLGWHLDELDRRDADVEREIAAEEAEQKKKITSEGIRDGWDASTVAKAAPSVLDEPKGKAGKGKGKDTVQEIEVLNPGAASKSPAPPAQDDDDDVSIGPLTPAARAFAQIAVGDFAASYRFIQGDASVLAEATYDGLMVEAFDAERRGDKALARRCVHQGLLVNYCRKLGRDGVGLFFKRMMDGNPKSLNMFNEDFNATYTRVAQRTAEMAAEEAAGGGAGGEEREQIQLVAEDPSMTIGFNLPDGPPPAELRIEGEGADQLDLDQVRAFLERKWDIFQAFPAGLQAALKSEKLDEVNKVLGRMKVAEAEDVVERLQEGGMLSFSESGVRDMTQGQ